ncbi:DUF885 domain-containing protein [Ningiella sp. W23]|uniref:DUF885 domain-containing protein n=1 Tax=Ningiella sp. W23 TaxID=3023715 RepID=UPI003757189B
MRSNKAFILSAACIAISMTLGACTKQNDDTATQGKQASGSKQVQRETVLDENASESQKLAKFFEDSFQQDLEMSPMRQSRLGLKWDYDKWDDVSPEAQEARVALMKERLARSKVFKLDELSEQERLSLRIYQTDLNRRLANDEFRLNTYVMNQFRGWHTGVPSFLINIHRINSIEDAEDYISRLEKVKPLFEQVFAQLKLREEAGTFPPRWAYDQMIQAADNVIKGNPFAESSEDSSILADFKSKLDALGISNAEISGLVARAEDALNQSVKPAYEKLIEVLSEQQKLSPEGDGVWRLAKGKQWYQNRLEWFTTTDLNALEVHKLGLEHVQRIHEQMREIMTQVNFEGSLQEFFVFMREDDQFYYQNTEEDRQRYMREAKEYIDIMEAKIPEYFGLTPKADMIIKRVEAFREQSAGKAFYQSPSRDGSRPGTYYANLYDMRSMPTYQMEALAYHEGIPGHHMQRAIAQELEGIPEFQKYVSFTVYTEGWGLYTEELAKDMGFYQDPYSDFGRLAMELWRACRLVVDTGIHDMQWSREKAIDYLITNTPNPENDAVKAIERYIALPGQATAYMIGKLKIMELRDKAKAQLGDNFSYAGFHDQVLMYGPIPLNILEEKIDQWVAENQA